MKYSVIGSQGCTHKDRTHCGSQREGTACFEPEFPGRKCCSGWLDMCVLHHCTSLAITSVAPSGQTTKISILYIPTPSPLLCCYSTPHSVYRSRYTRCAFFAFVKYSSMKCWRACSANTSSFGTIRPPAFLSTSPLFRLHL